MQQSGHPSLDERRLSLLCMYEAEAALHRSLIFQFCMLSSINIICTHPPRGRVPPFLA